MSQCLPVCSTDGIAPGLIEPQGTVRYSFTLTNGAAAVPDGSTLSFKSSSDQVSLTNASCVLNTATTTGTDQRAANAALSCTIDVVVTAAHAAAAKIPVFNIVAKYTGESTSRAFFIPSASTTSEVPVYAGATLSMPAVAVVDSDNSTFFQGEPNYCSWSSFCYVCGLSR